MIVLYWLIMLICIAIVCLAVYLFRRYKEKDTLTDISATMITSGIGLIISAFPGTKEMIIGIFAKMFKVNCEISTDYVAIMCGFLLIILGFVYRKSVRDRIFVLNMFGMFSQLEISDNENIKDLKLSDIKVKETIIDFVDVFQIGKLSNEKNKIIVEKIKKKCEAFKNRSVDFNACFTGMAPIPYTILAGTYLSGGSIKRFFEYRRSDGMYTELAKKAKKYPKLQVHCPEDTDAEDTKLTVAVSISMNVSMDDLEQFKCNTVSIGLEEPRDNVITSVTQLKEYANLILYKIEDLKNQYPKLDTVYLAASIPSCLSEQLGELFMLNSNRLPRIISCHYVKSSEIKYPFGIVVSDACLQRKGDLVDFSKGGILDV